MITVYAGTVLLPPDVRRALVLMGSELVINALKYGFPTEAGGTISVNLVSRYGEVELIVEDDGIGLANTYSAGQGGGLLEQLRVVLGATVTRTTSSKGDGSGFPRPSRSTCRQMTKLDRYFPSTGVGTDDDRLSGHRRQLEILRSGLMVSTTSDPPCPILRVTDLL